tara:strand:+ start:36909 stop:37550 length:642 start_codon:yes stop_codon:yes gene_type:complete
MQFRYEVKVPFRKDKIHYINGWIKKLPLINRPYPNRTINSLYYDTPFLKCANDNLIGISRRFKFRVRSYNNKNNYSFEIKEKQSSLGTKYRCRLQNFNLLSKTISSKNFNDNKLFYIKHISNHKLLPILEVNYLRSYYVFKNIRLTIDQKINYKDIRFNHNFSSNDNVNILEIKFDQIYLEEAKGFFKNFPFRSKRNSKYLRGLSILNIANYI